MRAWRPGVPLISEVFHARLVDYRYPPHAHDTWTVLIVDEGAVRYDLDKHAHGAVGDMVALVPPGVIHDGRPSERYGSSARKRNLYLDADFLPAELVGSAVDDSSFRDRELRAAISALHDRLARPEPLDVETRLGFIAERLARHYGSRPAQPLEPEPVVAQRLRDYLDEHASGRVTLADAALRLDRSVPHLVRSFKRRFGVTPYAYVVATRIEKARKRLLAGAAVGRVAVETGFFDQAHFTRQFKRHVSVTPGRYRADARLS